MTTVLIDGDVLAYRWASVLEEAWEIEPGYWVWGCNADEVKAAIRSEISNIMDHVGANNATLALTDSHGNFRKEILPTYKLHRASVKKPVVLAHIKQWMIDELQAYYRPKLEGDDILGILQTWPKFQRENGPTIVYSLDKDLKSIPGLYVRDLNSEPIMISKSEADRFHMLQTLTGDPTDGYKGCPGIGEKRASEILDKAESEGRPLWDAVVETYVKKGLDEFAAVIQARVARICRSSDWDFKTNTVIPWTPEKELA